MSQKEGKELIEAMLAEQQEVDGMQDIEMSDLSDKAPSPFEKMVSPLDQPTQKIQFGTLPEILINVVYILPEEDRRQSDWADQSDDELEEEFKREEDDLMALDEVKIEAEICEAEGELAKVLGSDNETDRFVF